MIDMDKAERELDWWRRFNEAQHQQNEAVRLAEHIRLLLRRTRVAQERAPMPTPTCVRARLALGTSMLSIPFHAAEPLHAPNPIPGSGGDDE